VKLVYHEPQPDISSAMKRERAIKTMTRGQKQKLVKTKRTDIKTAEGRSAPTRLIGEER
jgi:predicted GIY-YIG superfamily endonuclease